MRQRYTNSFRKIAITHSKTWDRYNIVEFYSAYSNPGNMKRAEDDIADVIEENNYLQVTDGNRELLGVSATFRHLEGKYLELGGTRIILNGFGLQKDMLAIRIVQQSLLDPSFEEIYSTVVRGNTKSIEVLEKSGMVLWENVPSDLLEEKRRIAAAQGRSSEVLFYKFPDITDTFLRPLAERLLDRDDSMIGHRTDPATQIHLHFNVAILKG